MNTDINYNTYIEKNQIKRISQMKSCLGFSSEFGGMECFFHLYPECIVFILFRKQYLTIVFLLIKDNLDVNLSS